MWSEEWLENYNGWVGVYGALSGIVEEEWVSGIR